MGNRAVYKSRAAEFLDDLFSGEGESLEAVYRSRQANLTSDEDEPLLQLATRLQDRGDLPPDIELEHFQRDWLSDESPMDGTAVDRVLRHGYEEAIRIASAGSEPLPIETLWMVGASEDFEVHICEGKRQVTVVLLIPGDYEYGSKRARSKSWVIRVASPNEDASVVAIQTSGARPAGD
jgi:hypothetical protein